MWTVSDVFVDNIYGTFVENLATAITMTYEFSTQRVLEWVLQAIPILHPTKYLLVKWLLEYILTLRVKWELLLM